MMFRRAEPRPTRDRARVLVIDDDPLFRSLLVTLLRKDYIVSVAGEGSEGFHKALEHPPDAAVIDIQMPGWDGLRTLQAFRSHPALSATKIVILTSDASKETVLAAIEGGANDYVIKTSFSRDEFHQKVRKLLSQRSLTKHAQPPAPAGPKVPVASNAVPAPVPAGSVPDDAEDRRSALQQLIDAWE
jgi:DNA-binding NarL/FixJ family response regulator